MSTIPLKVFSKKLAALETNGRMVSEFMKLFIEVFVKEHSVSFKARNPLKHFHFTQCTQFEYLC